MAVNAAWYELSDSARRTVYDASLRSKTRQSIPNQTSGYDIDLSDQMYAPARFPWRFVLIGITVGVVAVLFLNAFATDSVEPRPDNLLQSGSCVVIDPAGFAVETLCSETHDAVVERFIAIGGVCPSVTEAVRDKQGMGMACIRRK